MRVFKGLLIILFGVAMGYLMYRVYFKDNTGNLAVVGNYTNFNLKVTKLTNNEIVFDQICRTTKCEIDDLSPVKYKIEIKKKGFNEITETIKITGKTTYTFNANFTKGTELVLSKENSIDSENDTKNIEINSENIVIKENEESGNITINYDGNKIDFYKKIDGNDNFVVSLSKKSISKLEKFNIVQIFGTKYTFLIYDAENDNKNSYIFDINTNELFEIKLNNDIKYAKIGPSNNKYYIVTKNGTYIFDKYTKEIEYFYMFKDFVYFNNNYIGVIYPDEYEKFDIYNLTNNGKKLIINYNPEDLENYILLETDLNISKIYEKNGKIYFFNESGKKYELNNF